jgi:hypothetical protein
LEYICVQMETLGSKMSDANFLMYAVNNVPPEYDVIIDLLSRRIGSATDAFKIKELRSEMNLRFEQIQDEKRSSGKTESLFDNGGEEHALFAGGKFKGKCHHCGKFGHKV